MVVNALLAAIMIAEVMVVVVVVAVVKLALVVMERVQARFALRRRRGKYNSKERRTYFGVEQSKTDMANSNYPMS